MTAAQTSTSPPLTAAPLRMEYADGRVVLEREPIVSGTEPPRLPDVLIAGQLHTYRRDDVAEEVLRGLTLAREDDEYVDPESLQLFVDFIIGNPLLARPSFGIDPRGHVQVTWRPEVGTLATAAFRPNGVVRYAVATSTDGTRLSGYALVQEAASALLPHLPPRV